MRAFKFGAALVALLAVGLISSVAISQEKKPDAHAGPEAEAELAAWKAYRMVGPEHQMLKEQFAGTWDTEVKSFMGAPEITRGKTVNEMLLGGRFLHGRFEGTMAGEPFEGMGVTGFDNAKKKFFGTWIDSMGTGLMVTEGTYDSSSKTYTFTGEMTMPDGDTTKVRELIKVASNDKHSFEMYMDGPDGKEMKCLEITYTRAK